MNLYQFSMNTQFRSNGRLSLRMMCVGVALLGLVSYKMIMGDWQEQAMIVRVLLDEASESKAWRFQAKDGFLLFDATKKHKKLLPIPEMIVEYRNGFLYIQGRKVADRAIHILAASGNIFFEHNKFHGLISCVIHENKAHCINNVHLEDYVCCVLRTESWPGWPLEVNKVFAIASRSYAVAMMQKARKQNKIFDLRNTNKHQTYTGMHDNEIIKKAVEQTAGLVLTYQEKPIIAMFDACCGGVTPAHIGYFDFQKAPYLARTYPCKHCKKCKIFSWQVEFDRAQMQSRIWPVLSTSVLQDMSVVKKDKAGLIEQIQVKGPQEQQTIDGKKFYSLFKEVKSYCYKISKKGNKFRINGWGYGHHLGLCQWGAREMVREHWPYKKILSFYYPDTHLKKLTTI